MSRITASAAWNSPACRNDLPTTRCDRTGTASDLTSSGTTLIPSRDERQTLARPIKGQGPSGADADVKFLGFAGRVNNVEKIIGDPLVNANFADRALQGQDIVGIRTGCKASTGSPRRWLAKIRRSSPRTG